MPDMGEIPHIDCMAVPLVLAAAVANVPAFMQILKTGEWLFYLPNHCNHHVT